MTTRESKILLRYQLKDEVSSGLEAVSGNIKKHTRAAGIALTALGAAGVIVGKSAVAAAIEQQNAQRTLAATIEATGASWSDYRDEVLTTTAALQAKTNFGDEEQIRALITLTAALGDADKAIMALPLALGAASQSGRSLEAVVNTLGRALAGQTNVSISLSTEFQKGQGFLSRYEQGMRIVGDAAFALASSPSALGFRFLPSYSARRYGAPMYRTPQVGHALSVSSVSQ